MAVRIVRLGSPRHPKEGLRIGTVRRPPRGVPKAKFSSAELVRRLVPGTGAERRDDEARPGRRDDRRSGRPSSRKYRAEMSEPAPSQALDVLAALSKTSDFSVGCYCEDEAHCHRSVLRELLSGRGATMREADRRATIASGSGGARWCLPEDEMIVGCLARP